MSLLTMKVPNFVCCDGELKHTSSVLVVSVDDVEVQSSFHPANEGWCSWCNETRSDGLVFMAV